MADVTAIEYYRDALSAAAFFGGWGLAFLTGIFLALVTS